MIPCLLHTRTRPGWSSIPSRSLLSRSIVDTRIECGTGQDQHLVVKLIPKQPGIYSADLFLYNGVQYCYDRPAVGAQFAFFFRLQDCNADLLSGMDSSSVNIPSYTNLALTKRAFIFKVE